MQRILALLFFLALSLTAEDRILLGSGRWTYELLPDAIQLPEAHRDAVQDYHGVAVDSQGRVYFGLLEKGSVMR